MPGSIIVISDGEEKTVHISKLSPVKAARAIASYFYHYSTDEETTKVEWESPDDLSKPIRTVVMTNEKADDGSGPDHDVAHVLSFNLENMAWALNQTGRDIPDSIVECLTGAGVSGESDTEPAATTYGTAWCHGSDPEDGGWHFDNGGTVNGYDMAYETNNRDAAQAAGVPDVILDMYEKNGGKYSNEEGSLFHWLQQNSNLFRS